VVLGDQKFLIRGETGRVCLGRYLDASRCCSMLDKSEMSCANPQREASAIWGHERSSADRAHHYLAGIIPIDAVQKTRPGPPLRVGRAHFPELEDDPADRNPSPSISIFVNPL
jgi:hypothetical protein